MAARSVISTHFGKLYPYSGFVLQICSAHVLGPFSTHQEEVIKHGPKKLSTISH